MMILRRLISGAFAGFLLLAGVAEATTLNVQIAEAPVTLDPQKATGERPDQVIGDLFEGLVAEDANGLPVPGQADSWSISADGLTYTFHLRDGLAWSDGAPLTAKDFVFAFRRLVDPATGAELAYIQFPIKNAESIHAGKSENIAALGVAAPDQRTVIITLERSTPFFLQALLQPTAYPLPQHVVSKFGTDWATPEHVVGNGPYRLLAATSQLIRAARNEHYHASAALKIDSVAYHVIAGDAALSAYDEGRVDIATQYAAGAQDRHAFAHRVPALGLWYLALNSSSAPLERPQIREALSMAIDREALVSAIGAGDLPAFGMVPPGVPGFEIKPYRPDWAITPLNERQAQARRALAQASFSAGTPLRFTLRTSKRASQIRMAEAVAAMWREIGVSVDILGTETPVHQEALFKRDFTVAGARWIMDYNDAGDVLNLLRSDHPNNYQGYSNPALDAGLKMAAIEGDEKKRRRMLREAEHLAMEDTAVIPLFWMTSNNLVSPRITGFVDNVRDVHRTRWLKKRD